MKILHFSDLHIGRNNIDFDLVINTLIDAINAQSPDIIVCAGDVFDANTTYTSNDIRLFNKLMTGLSKYLMIVVPGNHDINPHTFEDLLSPVISSYTNVKYLKSTSSCEILGQRFHHISFMEGGDVIDNASNCILIYHGGINTTYFASNYSLSLSTINQYAYTILGDYHDYKCEPKYCYSGSPVQLNVSESPTKGFVVVDVAGLNNINPTLSPTLSHKFVPLNLPPTFLRLDFRGLREDQIINLVRKEQLSYCNPVRVNVILDNVDDETKNKIISLVTAAFGIVTKCTIIHDTFRPSDDIYEAITEKLDMIGTSDQVMLSIDELHRSHVEEYSYAKWSIVSAHWSNLFQYGPNNNLEFSPGVNGLVAPNRAGKSSIIDIIVLALFGELLRGDKSTMLRNSDGISVKQSHVKVVFLSNNVKYSIERVDTKTNTKLKLIMHGDVDKVITPKDVNTCYHAMRKLVGTLDQFLSTGLYYNNSYDIVNMKNSERLKILPEICGMTDNENLIKKVRNTVKVLSNELDAIATVPDSVDALKEKINQVSNQILQEENIASELLEKLRGGSSYDKKALVSAISKYSLRCEHIEQTLTSNEHLYNRHSHLKNQELVLMSKFDTVDKQLVSRLKSSLIKPKSELIQEYATMTAGPTPPEGIEYNNECSKCTHNKSLFGNSSLEDINKVKSIIDNYESLEDIKKISDIRKELKTLPDINEKFALKAELSMLKAQIADVQSQLELPCVDTAEYQLAVDKLAQSKSYLKSLQSSIEIREKYDAESKPIIDKLEVNKLYLKVISDPTFKVSVVNKSINRIISHANETIKFTDFTLSATCDDKKINLFLISNNTKLPIESGSGFQKFICSLAIRFALTSLISSSSQFIMIDEGFGCLDDKNLQSVIELLPNIALMYKFMFIITHVTNLKSAFSTIHNISISNNISSIGYQHIVNVDGVNSADAAGAKDKVKGKAKVNANAIITCECGAKIKSKSLQSHTKTAKHIKKVGK